MAESWKLAPSTVTLDGLLWVEIHRASKQAKTGIGKLREMISRAAIRSQEAGGEVYIPQSTVLRLREQAEFASRRPRAKLSYTYKWEPRSGELRGAIHAAREVQDVVPMSSGRRGKGWVGGNSAK